MTRELLPSAYGYSAEQAEFRRKMSTAEEIAEYLRRWGADELPVDVVLASGREFQPRGLPDKRWRRARWIDRLTEDGTALAASSAARRLACLTNSQRAAIAHGWRYVEGYA